MRFWWVNQNQTYRQEIAGGYLWSPKRNANGAKNHFYETMREVSPGDLIFSFVDTKIPAIGVADSYCFECLKPEEFGAAGLNWSNAGWKVDVTFHDLINKIRPKDHIDLLRALLPERYSPLQPNGNGNQAIYLAEVPESLANVLISLIGTEAQVLVETTVLPTSEEQAVGRQEIDIWESRIEQSLSFNDNINETERLALVKARRGQGNYRSNLMQIEKRCRITGVDNPIHLIASHAKPWRDCSNTERLDGENGLLLTPSIDHLFNDGFISFESNGELIISPVARLNSLEAMGVATSKKLNVGHFTAGQQKYLYFHRSDILKKTSS